MFPRIKLGEDDIVEQKFNTILPSRLKLMTMNSFVLEKIKVPTIPTDLKQLKKGKDAGEIKNYRSVIVPKAVTLQQGK